jgi:autotransporter-associated beta strand protein
MVILWLAVGALPVAGQTRLLGLDISAWQGNISATTWTNLRVLENRQFVFLRSSRGGTTGYYNQSDPANTSGLNTNSQRYDDPYFVQNINRSTTAGLHAGPYHFSRPDIIETTRNSGGVANTGTDEADHFIQMAGPWMRPGYLVPVHDFEAGDGVRTDEQMAQFCLDFSTRIHERMGIRPAIYINGNYAANILAMASVSLRQQLAQPPALVPGVAGPAYPVLWSARWPNQTDPDSINVQTGEPKDGYTGIYGPWDDYGVTHPWAFWQYASTGRLQSFNSGNSDLDFNVARGGIEFLKDQLVPAVWLHNAGGDWSTLTNWNSGQAPVAPVPGPGQVPPVGTQTLPVPRLPGAAAAGLTSGTNDTVILERPGTNITVTVSSGTHVIRKLYQRETLQLSGGSLSILYVPSPDSTPFSAQFSGPVTLGVGASLRVHTLQVDAGRTFTLNGGALAFQTLLLAPSTNSPASLTLGGGVGIGPLATATAVVARGAGAGNAGGIDLGGGTRTLTVSNGPAEVDLSLEVPVANGGLTKAGPGTLQLTTAGTYAGSTLVSAGRLLVQNTNGSATGPGLVNVQGGTLGGTGTIAGVVVVGPAGVLAPGSGGPLPGRLTLQSPPTLGGTHWLRIDRNGGNPTCDRLLLTTGTLTLGGTLVVTNMGAPLTGGEVFPLFGAAAYAGTFAAMSLPTLGPGLNWDLGELASHGRIRVNRNPVGTTLSFTSSAPAVLAIPLSSLAAGAVDADGDAVFVSALAATSTNGVPLVADGGLLLYSNTLNVADQFTYTLADGRGGQVAGLARVVPSPAGWFTGAPVMADGVVRLTLAGQPGRTYFLERSVGLVEWRTVGTNTASPGGTLEWEDRFTDLGAPPARAFYRLRWAP